MTSLLQFAVDDVVDGNGVGVADVDFEGVCVVEGAGFAAAFLAVVVGAPLAAGVVGGDGDGVAVGPADSSRYVLVAFSEATAVIDVFPVDVGFGAAEEEVVVVVCGVSWDVDFGVCAIIRVPELEGEVDDVFTLAERVVFLDGAPVAGAVVGFCGGCLVINQSIFF